MKSLKLTVFTIATLGTIASLYSIIIGTSESGYYTLWPSIALYSIAFMDDKVLAEVKCSK